MVPLRGRRSIDLLGDFTGETFGDFVSGARPIGYAAAPTWRPETDLFETIDAYHVVLDLAGVDPARLVVEFEGEILSVHGARLEGSRAGRRYHAMEIPAGRFERRVRISPPVDTAAITATYQHGILEIRLPKAEEIPTGKRRVPVG